MTKKTSAKQEVVVSRPVQKKWSFLPSTAVLVIGATLIVGYAAGTRHDQIIAAVAPLVGIQVEASSLDLSSVDHTFRQLKSNFDGTLDTQALIEGANRGLVAAAGDTHTEYFTAKEAEQFKNDLTGEIGGGIGAEIGLRDNKPTILRTLADTPAEKAGLQAGDQVVRVNDSVVTKQTVDQVVQKIRGEIGSTVKLSVLRGSDTKEFAITRQAITSPSVDAKIEGTIGILSISRFDEKTGEAARTAAQEFRDKGVTKVVLDLRDNGGGYLSAAPEVAGLWLDDKVVVSERQGGVTRDEQRSSGSPLLAGMPTVVLVNGSTASASEIVAAALKEYGVATLVGEKTYGKGTVQKMVELNHGALLKVTIQRWYTPKGNNVDKKGIAPHKVAGLTKEDIIAGSDPQLEAARTLLAN
ncbi:MAG: S41 family peptidase [Candidatus Saccharimonadales bacterium]